MRKFFFLSLLFVFNVGLLQPTAFKVGKFGFFLFAGETFVFLVELYSETFARALQRFFIVFNQISVIFLYIFWKGNNIYSFIKGLLHFGRNWWSWKGPNFKVNGQISVFLSSFPSDSSHQLHVFWHYCYSSSMDST